MRGNPKARGLATVACMFILWSAMATCYVVVDGMRCGPWQDASCANGCTQIRSTPPNVMYCDSRDGECGKTGCHMYQAPLTITYTWLTPYVDDNLNCTCRPPIHSVTMTNGTCRQAYLYGEQCGYCPNI